MTEHASSPDFHTSQHEIVGHEVTHRWFSDGVRYTRVQFVDGTVEEFEISEALAATADSHFKQFQEEGAV